MSIMKKQACILLTGLMMASAFLGGCGNDWKTAPKEEVSEQGSQLESSQLAAESENSIEKEAKAVLDEPYVLVRETYTKNGTVTEYGYDENGDKRSETINYPDKPDETLYREYFTQYQEDGSKIVAESQTMLLATGEPLSSETFEYEYNPDGLLIRKKGFANGEENGEIFYEYDGKGNLIAQSEGRPGGGATSLARTYEYDDAENLVKETVFERDGEISQYFTYEYDENGKQILTHRFTSTGEEPDRYELCEWKYEYDDEGRIVKEWKEGTEHGGKYEYYEYEYDEYGNLCKKRNLTLHTTYEYMPLSTYLEENGYGTH